MRIESRYGLAVYSSIGVLAGILGDAGADGEDLVGLMGWGEGWGVARSPPQKKFHLNIVFWCILSCIFVPCPCENMLNFPPKVGSNEYSVKSSGVSKLFTALQCK